MLDTVKQMLAEPFITFEQYYQNYIMSVQDESIEMEISFLLRNNFPSANSVMKLINQEIEGMKT